MAKTKETVNTKTKAGSIIKGILGLCLLGFAALSIGGYFMRREVIQQLQDRAITSSSVVLSRPFVLTRGINIKKNNLYERMRRLGYYSSYVTPSKPGEFVKSNNGLQIFLRGGHFSSQISQSPQLVQITHNDAGEITELIDAKFQQNLPRAILEPETLSLLGDSATRASKPRTLKDFPPHLINAIIAIEDERFYSHWGVDPIGIFRALVVNLSSGKMRQGGSTITQQLAKNLFFDRRRVFVRKVLEAFSALLIESAFTKNQILELYMNELFVAQEGNVAIHGFGEAAESFFAKDVKDISLAEAATLAGIIKAPTKLSPRLYPKEAKARRKLVLSKMKELGFISQAEETRAAIANLNIRPAERSRRVAPYFVDYIRRSVGELIETGFNEQTSLKIITGIDVEYQLCAERAVSNGLQTLEGTYPRLKKGDSPVQAALIVIDSVHGDPLAWIGGRDFGQSQFDRVSLSRRQPGSSFKPFVYLTALDKGLNKYKVARTTSILMDEPVSIPVPGSTTWEPKNYDNRYRGEVTVREALTHSLNIPTVELALKVGIKSIAETAEHFGFGTDLPRVPSLALGAGEISPLLMARAYAAIANGGILADLRPISAIFQEDDPEPIYQPNRHEERAATEAAVYVLTNILQGAIDRGTGQVIRRLGFNLPAAGKTGTSNDARDAWFAGFTPRILAVVWVGYDDNRELRLTGGQAAAPIWADFMKCVTPMEPILDFVPPPGVVFKKIDSSTGLLYTPDCPSEYESTEVFVEGSEPITNCTRHAGSFNSEEELYQEREVQDFPERAPSATLPPARRKPGQKNFWDRLFQ